MPAQRELFIFHRQQAGASQENKILFFFTT
jgi:hypothetical protein